MSEAMIAAALPWLEAPLMLAVMAFGAVALMTRSIFVTCVCLLAAGAAACVLLLVLGAGEGAVALALFAIAWAPLFLLAGMVLSKRAAKASRGRPWLSLAASAAMAALIGWASTADAPGPELNIADPPGLALWLAPLFLAAAAACVALVGFGERGALEDEPERRG